MSRLRLAVIGVAWGGESAVRSLSQHFQWTSRACFVALAGFWCLVIPVVVGAAAMELGAVSTLFAQLPQDFAAPILLAIHSIARAQSHSVMKTLAQATKLPCDFATDGQPIPARGVLVAPADRHMVVERSKIRVVFGPKENCHRPALDPLFEGLQGNTTGARDVVGLFGNALRSSGVFFSAFRSGTPWRTFRDL